ncbi:MAG: YebC/PmpR family DNA-binding transcriptional regulator [Bacteroidetes bacterium]|nr:YebC/PmpR family DNA-binding transcriptional regulator [Bacteroidota bacterium]
MGRIFEKRKHKMFARFDKMSKTFTKYGKEIAMAVKNGGPDPETNAKLRVVIANAKSENMPKDRIESAIKRAAGKDTSNYEEITYEAMCMKGVGLVIEAATDNPTRTVANVRMHLNRGGGELSKSGSLDFAFERKSVFVIHTVGINTDELELELIDAGLEDIEIEGEEMVITASFENFGNMQKALEAKGIQIVSAELQRIPTNLVQLTEEEKAQVESLIERLEEDDDVQNVYSNMA